MGLFFSTMQASTKQQAILNALANQQRRRGIDKSGGVPTPGITDLLDSCDAPTQPLDDLSQMTTIMEEDEPLLDEEESDSLDEAFNAQAEEIFQDKLDSWFADYAPKLFDLAVAKFLSKKAKAERNESKAESSKTSQPRKKSKK